MQTDAVKQLTSALWPFAIILIGFVILQASAFLKSALSFNKKYNVLTQAEINGAFRTGAISAVGPAFTVVVITHLSRWSARPPLSCASALSARLPMS